MKRFLFILFLAAIGLALYARHVIHAPLNLNQETVLEVKNGDSLYGVLNKLNAQGISHSAFVEKLYVKFSNKSNLVSGEYELKPGMSFKDVLDAFKQRNILQYKITFIEGWTVRQAIQALWQKEKLLKTLATDNPENLLQSLDFLKDYQNQRNAEGLFFPATYKFKKGMTDVDVLKMAYKKMQRVLDAEWQKRAKGLPYKTAYEALIMASIIEKETGVASEREEISGVFVRRLQKGMLLQTDPTVIYGMGERYQGNIRRRDLRQDTPYNTYVRPGLPPTPIALPGRKSIAAAVNPKPGSSLYFVADGDGGHVFSDSLAQHNRAVKNYLKKLRSRR